MTIIYGGTTEYVLTTQGYLPSIYIIFSTFFYAAPYIKT